MKNITLLQLKWCWKDGRPFNLNFYKVTEISNKVFTGSETLIFPQNISVNYECGGFWTIVM